MIGWAGAADTAAVRGLWEAAFGDEQPYTDWYFREVYRPSRTLVLKQAEQVLSSLQLAPYRLQTPHGAQNAAFIVGVVTAEPARGQGFAGALLNRALTELSHKGFPLALLYTDIPAFYEPLGFSCCYHLRQLTFPAAASSAAPAAFRRCLPDAADLAACDRIYRCMCSDLQGWIIRSPLNWRLYTEDWLNGGQNELWLADNAYLLTDTRPEGLTIKEIGYTSSQALDEALYWASALAARKGWDRFCWAAPEAAPLPPQADERLLPWVMARLTADAGGDPAAASAVRSYLGAPSPLLWINEIT